MLTLIASKFSTVFMLLSKVEVFWSNCFSSRAFYCDVAIFVVFVTFIFLSENRNHVLHNFIPRFFQKYYLALKRSSLSCLF